MGFDVSRGFDVLCLGLRGVEWVWRYVPSDGEGTWT